MACLRHGVSNLKIGQRKSLITGIGRHRPKAQAKNLRQEILNCTLFPGVNIQQNIEESGKLWVTKIC